MNPFHVLKMVIFIACTTESYASQAQNFYYHYEIRSSDHANTTFDIVALDSDMYLTLNESRWGKPVDFYGKHNKKSGQVELFSLPDSSMNLTFRFYGQDISKIRLIDRGGATIIDYSESIASPLSFRPFKLYWTKRIQKLIEMQNSPEAIFEYLILEPQMNKLSGQSQKIRYEILSECLPLYSLGNYEKSTDQLIEETLRQGMRFYVDEFRDVYDPNSINQVSLNQELIVKTFVTYNSNNILSIKIVKYAYSGGAHGLEVMKFINFLSNKGKKLELSDLFDTENAFIRGSLINLVITELKKNYHLNDNETMGEAGFFEVELPLSSEFYITRNGIGFIYNPYEIAPYAMGCIEVFLKWEKVKELLKEQAIEEIFGL